MDSPLPPEVRDFMRRGTPQPTSAAAPLDRIAAALERIAAALEQRAAAEGAAQQTEQEAPALPPVFGK